MELLFENRYIMSKQRYIEWAKNPIKKSIFRIIWPIIIIFVIVLLVESLFYGDPIIIALYIVLALYSIYRCFFRMKVIVSKQFKIFATNQGKEEWERIIQFSDIIEVNDGNTKAEYKWSQVDKFIIDEHYIILAFKNNMGIRLIKDGFTKGTANGFYDYIKKEYEGIPMIIRK